MNYDRLSQLTASILDPAKPFDLSVCETCIAGHAFELAEAAGLKPETFTHALQQWLDISEHAAFDIFSAAQLPLDRPMYSVTREEAVSVLQRFVDHGVASYDHLAATA